MGNAFSGHSSFFVYQVSFFLSFSFCLSSLFQFLSRCKGLSPDWSISNLLSLKMLSLNEALYCDCFILRLKLDSSCAFLDQGNSRLVFSSILTAICAIVAL